MINNFAWSLCFVVVQQQYESSIIQCGIFQKYVYIKWYVATTLTNNQKINDTQGG